MVDYEKLYDILFNGITDTIANLEKQNYGLAKDNLIKIQQKAEDIYIQADD
jgi:hypothetical protein